MSYGFYRMGSAVPGKRLGIVTFGGNTVIEQPVRTREAPPNPPPNIQPPPEDDQAAFKRAVAKGMFRGLMPPPQTAIAPPATPTLATDQALWLGYTGDECMTCGSMRMRQTGTCATCEECGNTAGCS